MPIVYVKSREDRAKLQGYIYRQYGDSYSNEICGTPPSYGVKSDGPRTTAAMISLAKEVGIEASATPIKSPAKDSTDRRARLHRALDCVLDRAGAGDVRIVLGKVTPGGYEFQRGDSPTAAEFIAKAKAQGFNAVITKRYDNRGWCEVEVSKK